MNGGGERLGASEYAELVMRVAETVTAAVPVGASVLVVSKGDAGLLDLPGLSAAHFPQDQEGSYAGHHPPDGAVARGELEALRQGGFEYLVIPETSRWWLDYYGELADHLAADGELVADAPGTCLVYALSPRLGEASSVPVLSSPQAGPEQLRDYLECLFPADCELVVLEAEQGIAAALAPLRAVALALREEAEGDGELMRGLAAGAAEGARFLVVPRSSDGWLRRRAPLEEMLGQQLRMVADQRHLCRVYEINQQMEIA
jgi:hypothetical protein